MKTMRVWFARYSLARHVGMAPAGAEIDQGRGVFAILLGVGLLAIAVALRLPNLGKLGLWGDEGYTAIAVKAILEQGYPVLPTGGLYFRYLPLLYVDALSASFFGLNEFTLRLPSVLANLGAIGMTYLLGKLLFGKTIGAVAAAMMVFASWEIEFARHARMYATFQFLFLLSLYLFFKGFIEGQAAPKWLTLPVCALTLMVHELGIVLAVVFLVPFFIKDYPKKRLLKLLAIAFVFAWCGRIYILWVRYGMSARLAEEDVIAHSATESAILPLELFSELIEGSPGLVYGMALAWFIAVGVIIRRSFRMAELRWQYLFLVPVILLCVAGQLGFALIGMAFYTVVFFKHSSDWRQVPFITGIIFIVAGAMNWICVAWMHGWSATRLAHLFLDFPRTYELFIKYFLTDWPVEAGLATLGALLLWSRYLNDRDNGAMFALAAVVGPLLFVSLLPDRDDGARYSFHLYPLLLLWGSYGLVIVARRCLPAMSTGLIATAAAIIMLLIPSDMQLVHGIRIPERAYGDYFKRPHVASSKAFPFYPDYKTTGEYIRRHLGRDDIVVSVRETVPFYYVGRIDYVWSLDGNSNSNALGLKEIDTQEFKALAKKLPGKRFWLLTDPFRTRKQKGEKKEALAFLDTLAECTVYRGLDAHTAVYLFSADREGRRICLGVPLSGAAG